MTIIIIIVLCVNTDEQYTNTDEQYTINEENNKNAYTILNTFKLMLSTDGLILLEDV